MGWEEENAFEKVKEKKIEVKRKISVFQVFLLTTQLTKHLFLNLLLCEIGGKMWKWGKVKTKKILQ